MAVPASAPERACVACDEPHQVGLPLGAGLFEEMMEVGLHRRFRHTEHGADRRRAIDLDHGLKDAQLVRREPELFPYRLEGGYGLQLGPADEDCGHGGVVEPGRGGRRK